MAPSSVLTWASGIRQCPHLTQTSDSRNFFPNVLCPRGTHSPCCGGARYRVRLQSTGAVSWLHPFLLEIPRGDSGVKPGLRELTLSSTRPFPVLEDSLPSSWLPQPRGSHLSTYTLAIGPTPPPVPHMHPAWRLLDSQVLRGNWSLNALTTNEWKPSGLSSALCLPLLTPESRTCHSVHVSPLTRLIWNHLLHTSHLSPAPRWDFRSPPPYLVLKYPASWTGPSAFPQLVSEAIPIDMSPSYHCLIKPFSVNTKLKI